MKSSKVNLLDKVKVENKIPKLNIFKRKKIAHKTKKIKFQK